jgi:hypothetical protein
MTEMCCQLGEHRGLAGIISEPVGPRRRALCVLVNAGLVPKSGPYRLYVELARRLARDGIVTLRFDLGGIGDSRPHTSGQPLKERTSLEIRTAIDELCRRYPEVRQVIVGGVCSGAEDAFRHAEVDPRVTGVVMIDPFSYRTAGWWWRHLAFRAVRRALRAAKLYEPVIAPRVTAADGSAGRVVSYHYMEHAESSRILKAMISRRVRVHFIYTGSQSTFNHTGQLQQMFDGIAFEGCVTLDHLPRLDHTQLLAEDRAVVANAVGAWLARC